MAGSGNKLSIFAISVAAILLPMAGVATAKPGGDHGIRPNVDRIDGQAAVSLPAVPGRLLTPPSTESPVTITRRYLRESRDAFGLDNRDLSNLRLVARAVSPEGITRLRFNQVLEGIESFSSGVDAHVTAQGRLAAITSTAVPGAALPATSPATGAKRGLAGARRAIGAEPAELRVTEVEPGPERPTTFESGESSRLRWVDGEEGPQLVWQSLAEDEAGGLYDVLTEADGGGLVRRQGLTSHLGESRYFPLDPDTNPDPVAITMPPEWISEHTGGTRLWGEYSRTYSDPADENPAAGNEFGGARAQIPASNGNAQSPDWLYTQSHDFPGASPCPASGCTWDSEQPSTRTVNEKQAGANLHVLVNRFHDHLKQAPIGFDEASGNFQLHNPSGQGLGGDYVRAELNDGSGINNANMGTPPDGHAPRMQMYLFDLRDVNGSDAADIVYHEYGHGLSSRLVVTASGSSSLLSMQPNMMGEGWSDFYALDLVVAEGSKIDTPAPGEVTTGDYVKGPGGVRGKPIDCPVAPEGLAGCDGTRNLPVAGGYTYGDLAITNNASPHNGGEVWAETLWDIRTAFGRQAALKLITGGMRMTGDDPSMLDARDGILQQAVAMRSSVGAPDDFYAALWQLFAARGMGAGASSPSAASTEPTESYDLPAGIRAGKTTISDPYPGGDEDGRIEAGERFVVEQVIEGIGSTDLSGVTGVMTSSDPAVTIESGNSRWPLLGHGRAAANTDELAGRLPAGVCSAVSPISIAVTSTEGGATASAVIDPRPGTSEVTMIPEPEGTSDEPILQPARAEFTVPTGGTITDVDLRIDDLRHYFLGDLAIALRHDGVEVEITNRFGDSGFNGQDIIDAVFDDEAAALPGTGTSPVTGRVKPSGSLADLDGHPAAGLWVLEVVDMYPDDENGGELRRWGIDSPEAGCDRPEIPEAQTGFADRITQSAATLHGRVTPNGRETGARISYGKTDAYGASTPVVSAGEGDEPFTISHPVGALEPDTTYHYRVESMRKGKVAVAGEDRTFRTAPPRGPHVDFDPPVIEGKIKVGLKGSRKAKRRPATFGFSVNEAASITLNLSRKARGIRRGGRCVKPGKLRGKRCVRQVRAGVIRGRATAAGPVALRTRGKGLARGRYTARITATDDAGNTSSPRTFRFQVR
jgi:subtilisin-like proprotein convertase family protein